MNYTTILIVLPTIFFSLALFCESKSLIKPQTGIRSDVIVTSPFNSKPSYETSEESQEKPGWLRRQLLRFGEMTNTVGNKLGGFTSKLANGLDKICGVIKTIIPVIAAVCHVGEFQFCGSINEAPQEIAEALSSSNLDLNVQD